MKRIYIYDRQQTAYQAGYQDASIGYGWQSDRAGRRGSRQYAAYSAGYADGGAHSGSYHRYTE